MTQPPWHRTKIVCTLGPATGRPGVLAGLIGAGLDIVRCNMSHGDPTDHARRIQQVRHLARQTGQPVAVLIDGLVLASDPISLVACQLAARLNAKAIIVPVHDLATALGIARFRPQAPLVAVTDSEDLRRRLTAVWGVSPLLAAPEAEPSLCLTLACHWLYSRQLAQPGDPAVVLATSSLSQGKADTMQVVRLPDVKPKQS